MPQSELPRPHLATQIRRISLDSIEMNPDQPRSRIDDQPLEELASSIRLKGIIQPVVVREVGGGYQLVAGRDDIGFEDVVDEGWTPGRIGGHRIIVKIGSG